MRVDDEYADLLHCRIFETATGFRIQDLGSTNGTYVLPVVGGQIKVGFGRLMSLPRGARVMVGRSILPWAVDR